jgi:hypothetical protein
MKYPRLLIVGTVPYNRQSTSRAFDAYFHNWPHDKIAQVFSNSAEPLKGHCGTLFQITDKMLLDKWLHKDVSVGKIYYRDNLQDENTTLPEFNPERVAKSSVLYRFGTKHSPLTHLLRKLLWQKRYWNTPEFNSWLEEFNPECVFLSFSNDFFILEIALYVARKFNIPICSSTGDDYYFDGKFSLDPLYYLYHEWYKSLNRKVFRHKGSAIYIGDKIRDKYNEAFNLDGETVFLVSDIQRRAFKEINQRHCIVRYFGNIRLGRNNSICAVAQAFQRIDSNITIEVYSNECDDKVIKVFKAHPNIKFCGVIPYAEVMTKTLESDILLVVEGTTKQDINLSRYALSTKVADSLASGCNIVGYGSSECGAIEYMEKIGCVTLGHSIDEMEAKLRMLLSDVNLQKRNYDEAHQVYLMNHTRDQSNARVLRIVKNLTARYSDEAK